MAPIGWVSQYGPENLEICLEGNIIIGEINQIMENYCMVRHVWYS